MFCWQASSVQIRDKKNSYTLHELLSICSLKFIFLSSFQKNHKLRCYNQDSHIIHVLFTVVSKQKTEAVAIGNVQKTVKVMLRFRNELLILHVMFKHRNIQNILASLSLRVVSRSIEQYKNSVPYFTLITPKPSHIQI